MTPKPIVTKPLAKALHTLTTVPNVAKYLLTQRTYGSGAELARAALMVCNPDYDYSAEYLVRVQRARSNELIARIVDACDTALAAGK